MGKQPVLTYSIVGIAVAIAIAVITSSTLGLTSVSGDSERSVAGFAIEPGAASAPVQVPAAQPGVVDARSNGGDVEYVYVDEPEAAYIEDEHEDDDEHERDERERHDQRDDDDDDDDD